MPASHTERCFEIPIDDTTQNIIVEGNEGYKKAQTFMKMIMPSGVKKVKKYRGKVPLFIEENIESKMQKMFEYIDHGINKEDAFAMILMDSENQLAMNLGETYLVTDNGNERLGKQKLDLVVL